MKKRRILKGFLMLGLTLALVLTGMSFQGIQVLEAAEQAMDNVSVDKTALAEAISKAEAIKSTNYSVTSRTKLKTALDAAKKINEQTDATQEQVDQASKALNTAIGNLVKIPGKPSSVKLTWKGKKSVAITWKKAANATRYMVYRSVKGKSTGFKKIATVTKTSYTDNFKDKAAVLGKTAYYKVVAYNGNVKGTASAATGVYIPKTPANVKASASKTTVTVSFQKSSRVSGYEIWRATKRTGTYRRVATITSASTIKKKILNQTAGTYYYKVRAYKTNGTKKVYTDFGKVATVKVSLGSTIENTKSQYTIEADVKLTGTGTGYHAKLVMATPTSAVSYGIQYDAYAEAPYTGKAMALIENVSSNDAGGQRYTRPGDNSLQLNKTYHLMMTVDKNGNGDVYLDYKKIGSFSQPNLVGNVALRIEAAARVNGDSVNATFSNIKCKWGEKFDSNAVLGKSLSWVEFRGNPGVNYKYNKKSNNIQIYGTIGGVNGDWDSDFGNVQDILQFVFAG